ncbi:MAG TPA: RodZ domain-containing protein [Steroidobacteraceae bacterium]|nr:RodZ domain-containing protein [Steroidobacteraceae bacterium]
MSRDEQPAGGAPGPGARLRAARERLGLSVQQVADRLRLNPRVIEGIEADDYSAVGAPVYVRGHLRRVANLVGESEAEIEALFRSGDAPKAMPDLTRIVTQKYRGAQQQRQTRLGTWPTVIVGLLILLGGLVWWAMQQAPRAPSGTQVLELPVAGTSIPLAPTQEGVAKQGGSDVTSAAAPAPVSRPPGTTTTQALVPKPTSVASVVPAAPSSASAAGATPAVNASPMGAAPASAAPASAPRGSTTSGGPATGSGSTTLPPTARAAPVANAAPGGGDRLALRFKDDSWVEVYAADGSRLYYDVGSAGSVHELSGSGPWRVVLGNGAAVQLTVNGRPVNLSREVRDTPNVRLSLDRSGRASEIQ